MLGHLSFGVSDLARARAFYDAIMSALGYVCVHADERFVGYGLPGTTADKLLRALPGPATPPGQGFHLCFDAPTRAAVDDFHAAGLGAGGRDNGAPGLRPHYGPDYYAAFLIDPDGHRLEAKLEGGQLKSQKIAASDGEKTRVPEAWLTCRTDTPHIASAKAGLRPIKPWTYVSPGPGTGGLVGTREFL